MGFRTQTVPSAESAPRSRASAAGREHRTESNMPDNPPIIAGTRIGHVHLKVADLDRALGFYCGVLGFEVMQRMGSGAAFISAGGYHHHIGLNTWESKGGHPPPPGTTGLFHTAILYPTRPALADALHRVIAGRHPARRRQRPRRQRGALSARSRRERRRTLPRPAGGRMAARGRRIAGDVHEAAGSWRICCGSGKPSPSTVIARSTCDEAIHCYLFAARSDCFVTLAMTAFSRAA